MECSPISVGTVVAVEHIGLMYGHIETIRKCLAKAHLSEQVRSNQLVQKIYARLMLSEDLRDNHTLKDGLRQVLQPEGIPYSKEYLQLVCRKESWTSTYYLIGRNSSELDRVIADLMMQPHVKVIARLLAAISPDYTDSEEHAFFRHVAVVNLLVGRPSVAVQCLKRLRNDEGMTQCPEIMWALLFYYKRRCFPGYGRGKFGLHEAPAKLAIPDEWMWQNRELREIREHAIQASEGIACR